MRIHISANYEGYTTAQSLRDVLSKEYEVFWHGPPEYDDNDDYPIHSIKVAQAVVADEDAGDESRGLIIGGFGSGETIAANKVNGARAVPGLNSQYVVSARNHADANILIVPTEVVSESDLIPLIKLFLSEQFSNEFDDARRLVNLAEFETAGTIEGWTIEQ